MLLANATQLLVAAVMPVEKEVSANVVITVLVVQFVLDSKLVKSPKIKKSKSKKMLPKLKVKIHAVALKTTLVNATLLPVAVVMLAEKEVPVNVEITAPVVQLVQESK